MELPGTTSTLLKVIVVGGLRPNSMQKVSLAYGRRKKKKLPTQRVRSWMFDYESLTVKVVVLPDW
jgi:hypothetical protein